MSWSWRSFFCGFLRRAPRARSIDRQRVSQQLLIHPHKKLRHGLTAISCSGWLTIKKHFGPAARASSIVKQKSLCPLSHLPQHSSQVTAGLRVRYLIVRNNCKEAGRSLIWGYFLLALLLEALCCWEK